jgi:prepilin-type N-terminal cleavage/methylation domain-containing protein
MISLKRKQSGFTIVELLIVIIVIGILAALVLVTFSGVQQKARNTERQTDIKSVASHLETYNAQEGFYPTAANMNDPAFISANLKGLDPASACDPRSADVASPPCDFATGAATGQQYGYVPAPADCTNDPGEECTSFVLHYQKEGEAANTDINSLSN